MKFYRIDKGYRYIRRYRQIVGVFAKYGFAHFLDQLNIARRIRIGRFFVKSKSEQKTLSVAARLRFVLEDLGPTFIKVGQLLSTRSFLLPPDFIEEFARLQDKVKPVDYENIVGSIEKELEGKLEDVFDEFHKTPIASASIAQVYRARLKTGEEVVVKVQRPNITKLIDTDMSILRDLASLVEKHIEESRQYEPVSMVEELSRTMNRELNFTNEAGNIEKFAQFFKSDPNIYIPHVHWPLCTNRVLTLEYIDGIKVTHIDQFEEFGIDRKKIADYGTKFILEQIFKHGFFHADPHPGNLFLTRDGKIAPIDFGIMGILDEWLMDKISDLLIGVWRRDIELIIRVLVDLGAISLDAETRQLSFELSGFMNRYYGVPISRINMKRLINEAFDIISRHRLKIPANLMLLTKTIGTYEDLARKLDPDYNFINKLQPYIKKLVLRRLDPNKVGYDLSKSVRDLYDLIKMMPRELELILRRMRQGRMAIELQHRGIDLLIREMDSSFRRLSFSMIIASLIVASSLIMRLDKGYFLFGYPLLGIIGYLFAGVLGIGLLINILRSGKL